MPAGKPSRLSRERKATIRKALSLSVLPGKHESHPCPFFVLRFKLKSFSDADRKADNGPEFGLYFTRRRFFWSDRRLRVDGEWRGHVVGAKKRPCFRLPPGESGAVEIRHAGQRHFFPGPARQ